MARCKRIPDRYASQDRDRENWLQLIAFGTDENGISYIDILKLINQPRKDRRRKHEVKWD